MWARGRESGLELMSWLERASDWDLALNYSFVNCELDCERDRLSSKLAHWVLTVNRLVYFAGRNKKTGCELLPWFVECSNFERFTGLVVGDFCENMTPYSLSRNDVKI